MYIAEIESSVKSMRLYVGDSEIIVHTSFGTFLGVNNSSSKYWSPLAVLFKKLFISMKLIFLVSKHYHFGSKQAKSDHCHRRGDRRRTFNRD